MGESRSAVRFRDGGMLGGCRAMVALNDVWCCTIVEGVLCIVDETQRV